MLRARRETVTYVYFQERDLVIYLFINQLICLFAGGGGGGVALLPFPFLIQIYLFLSLS